MDPAATLRRRLLGSIGLSVIVAAGLIVGCRDHRAIEQARAKLDLARQTADLPATFLALRDLQALTGGSIDIDHDLQTVAQGLDLEATMKSFTAQHDHENAVQAAGALLEKFPRHLLAQQTLKESGLIYRSLEQGIAALRACLAGEASTDLKMVTSESQDAGEIDYDGILDSLERARGFSERAASLDSLFERAIALRALVDKLREVVVTKLALDVGGAAERDANSYASMYSTLLKGLQAGSPQAFWRRVGNTVDGYAQASRTLADRRERRTRLLLQFGSGIAIAKESAELSLQVSALLDDISNPKGNVYDYKAAVVARRGHIADLDSRVVANLKLRSTSVGSLLEDSARSVDGFQLYRTPELTTKVLEQHRGLIES